MWLSFALSWGSDWRVCGGKVEAVELRVGDFVVSRRVLTLTMSLTLKCLVLTSKGPVGMCLGLSHHPEL